VGAAGLHPLTASPSRADARWLVIFPRALRERIAVILYDAVQLAQ
jgi:hypothetical protein